MDATQLRIAATVRAAGQIGESECTVEIDGLPVKVFVPDHMRFESSVSPARLAKLHVLASKPITAGRN